MAVVLTTGYPKTFVNGNQREWLYRGSWGAADTLDVPLHIVNSIAGADDTVTAFGVTSATLTGSKVRITFATANTGGWLRVMGQ